MMREEKPTVCNLIQIFIQFSFFLQMYIKIECTQRKVVWVISVCYQELTFSLSLKPSQFYSLRSWQRGDKEEHSARCVLVKLGRAEAAGSVGKDNDAVKLLAKSFRVLSPCVAMRGQCVARVIATKTKTEVIICPHCSTNGEKRWLGIRLTGLKESGWCFVEDRAVLFWF